DVAEYAEPLADEIPVEAAMAEPIEEPLAAAMADDDGEPTPEELAAAEAAYEAARRSRTPPRGTPLAAAGDDQGGLVDAVHVAEFGAPTVVGDAGAYDGGFDMPARTTLGHAPAGAPGGSLDVDPLAD